MEPAVCDGEGPGQSLSPRHPDPDSQPPSHLACGASLQLTRSPSPWLSHSPGDLSPLRLWDFTVPREGETGSG